MTDNTKPTVVADRTLRSNVILGRMPVMPDSIAAITVAPAAMSAASVLVSMCQSASEASSLKRWGGRREAAISDEDSVGAVRDFRLSEARRQSYSNKINAMSSCR